MHAVQDVAEKGRICVLDIEMEVRDCLSELLQPLHPPASARIDRGVRCRVSSR